MGRYFYFTDTRSAVHRYQVVPLLRWIYSGDDIPAEAGGKGPGAEKAHEVGLKALRALYDLGFGLRERGTHGYLEGGELGVEVIPFTRTPLPSTTTDNGILS